MKSSDVRKAAEASIHAAGLMLEYIRWAGRDPQFVAVRCCGKETTIPFVDGVLDQKILDRVAHDNSEYLEAKKVQDRAKFEEDQKRSEEWKKEVAKMGYDPYTPRPSRIYHGD